MKKILMVLIVSLLCLSINIPVQALESYTTVFEYPPVEELNKLEKMEEKYKAVNIEEHLLKQLTNNQLIEAIKDYPYLFNIYAFDDFEEGYEQLKNHFSGLRELESRKINLADIKKTSINNSERTLLEKTMERILYRNNGANISLASTATVKTPKGTSVTVLIYTELSASEIKELDNYVKKNYPSTVLLSSASRKYNCHSYAWYSASTSNKYWMNDPSAYMKDGSYTQKSSGGIISANYRIYYKGQHSGIVSNSGYERYNNIYVKSKWGQMGLVSHKIFDCPYTATPSYWAKS